MNTNPPMPTPESQTPRTDKEFAQYEHLNPLIWEHTRTLELELAQAKEQFAADVKEITGKWVQERDAFQQQVEKLKEDLKWRIEHMAESDKELCQIEDWLRAGCDMLQSSSDVAAKVKERIRDLIAKEGELGDARHQLTVSAASNAKLTAFVLRAGHFNGCAWYEDSQFCDCGYMKLSETPDQALAEWVEFVKDCSGRGDFCLEEIKDKARQLLTTIKDAK